MKLKKIKDNWKFIIQLTNGEKLVNIALFNNLNEAIESIYIEAIDYVEIYHDNNRIYFEDYHGYWTKRKYDKNNNLISYESSTGYWFKRKFDKNNNQIYYEDYDGYWSKSKYDKNNNLISLENSNGYWYKRKFDKNNNQISLEYSDGYKRNY